MDQDIVIRKAELADAAGIAKVHVATWQHAYRGQIADSYLDSLTVENRTNKWLENLSRENTGKENFVAEIQGEIVGFCAVGPNRDESLADKTGELYAIYVEPTLKGKGVGSLLMSRGLEFLKAKGYKEATLFVLDTNTDTRKFYEKKGWANTGDQKIVEIGGHNVVELIYKINL